MKRAMILMSGHLWLMLGASLAAQPPLLSVETVRALADELSGTHAKLVVQELTEHHRMRASQGYRAAAEAVLQQAEQAGLETEIIELPADGKIYYGTQRSRPAWNVEFAELWQVEENGNDLRIASYQLRPLTVAQDSASGRAETTLVDIGVGTSEVDYQGKEIAGKLVLTSSQPGAVSALAVDKYGAAGIISYAQNQKSAWWGEDRNLVRWGHLNTFPAPTTFGFMVTVNQALKWQQEIAAGRSVNLRAVVEAARQSGAYLIPTALIRGSELPEDEIVFSCHLDHPRPGANDNASGCATILEVARALAKLIDEGKIERPRRSIRFVWPPEIEGTIALLNARPEIAENARAVLHLDMVGGSAEVTKSIFHVTRSPRSLPTFVNDVSEAFARFVNEQSYWHSAGREVEFPLVDPEGSRQALQARIAPFFMGSDHQVWAAGSFRVPAIYLNDWPDRYIHTDRDHLSNIDSTKLLRAAFISAASGYYLANLGTEEIADLLAVIHRQAVERTAGVLAEMERAEGYEEAANLAGQHVLYEQGVIDSIGTFVSLSPEAQHHAKHQIARLQILVGEGKSSDLESSDELICTRTFNPRGPMNGFGYSYFSDQLQKQKLEQPELLSYQGRSGGGAEYAYEVLNLIDGERSAAKIRDAVAATYGPVPVETVREYLQALTQIGVVVCGQ